MSAWTHYVDHCVWIVHVCMQPWTVSCNIVNLFITNLCYLKVQKFSLSSGPRRFSLFYPGPLNRMLCTHEGYSWVTQCVISAHRSQRRKSAAHSFMLYISFIRISSSKLYIRKQIMAFLTCTRNCPSRGNFGLTVMTSKAQLAVGVWYKRNAERNVIQSMYSYKLYHR